MKGMLVNAELKFSTSLHVMLGLHSTKEQMEIINLIFKWFNQEHKHIKQNEKQMLHN